MRSSTVEPRLQVWAILLIGLLFSHSVFSPPGLANDRQTAYQQQEAEIPTNPSTPPSLLQKIPSSLPSCERFFVYRGQTLGCDSNGARDASGLRRVVQGVPSAAAELDHYLNNQKKAEIAAYATSLGLLAMIVGIFMSRPPVEGGHIQPGGYPLIGGLGLALFSLPYSLIVTKTNDSHLGNAVQFYNDANPNDPVRLEFKTSLHF